MIKYNTRKHEKHFKIKRLQLTLNSDNIFVSNCFCFNVKKYHNYKIVLLKT